MAKKKKRRLKIKNILICLLLFILIGYIFYYILMLPINNIYVSGNDIVTESEILSLANLDSYPSFLLTRNGEVKRNILENEYIEEVKIKRELGNKLYIEVVEYIPLCILSNGEVLLPNGESYENNYSITDIPYLVSELNDEKVFNDFIKRFAKIDKDILRQISQIEYLPVEVDKERFLLYMDDGNEVYVTLTKLDKLNKYNEIVEKMDGSQGIIYLDSGDYVEIRNATEVINVEE